MVRFPRSPRCPHCPGTGLPILYGMPNEEGLAMWKRGEVVLGGCIVTRSQPTHECTTCGQPFRVV